ncbi:MAG: hypothetical protein ACRDPZ_14380, partial [Gaiellaceae bacterium]
MRVETVARFDAWRDELPGGIAFGAGGTMYVGLALLGEIRRLELDGSWSTVFRVDPGKGGPGILG